MDQRLIRSLSRLLATLLLVALAYAPAFAQGATTSTITGVAVDKDGGLVPGATVTVKNNATGRSFNTVTSGEGTFSVPALEPGTYAVTITLSGFKTFATETRLAIGTTAEIKAVLQVGELSEVVNVVSSSEIVNTQSNVVSSTLNADQLNRMPVATRNLINAVTFLPGVNTATTNRNSTVNGLPESFIAISLDGVTNNDNFNKSSDGFFASVTPRPDAIEAVQVTTAGAAADVGAHGSVQINFVTRSGTNQFTGSGYHYYRAPALNTNYVFNEFNRLPKNDVTVNQYGGRQGGPIVVPGVYDGRGKAFFFYNYEQLRLPNNFTRTRVVATPAAMTGVFSYTVSGAVRTVNVLDVAAANGRSRVLDPDVVRVLNDIRAASLTTGVLNPRADPNTIDYVWQSPGYQKEWQPTAKIDYNFNQSHRISASFSRVTVERDPDHLNGDDRRFPGFANYGLFRSVRPLLSTSLRSTLGANLVNELRIGGPWGRSQFGHFDHTDGPQTFEPLGGYAMALPNIGTDLTDPFVSNGTSWRGTPSLNIDNTVNWQRGRHSLSFGGAVFIGTAYEFGQQRVPGLTFGVADADPAAGLFTTTNFPGASNAQLGNAEALYAMLIGSLTSVSGQLALNEATNQYEYLGARKRAGRMNTYSAFLQDSWRLKPTLTLNVGLRWDVQTPFQPTNDIMSTSFLADACGVSGIGSDGDCRFFQPGASGGIVPSYVQYDSGRPGWNTDWNNVAPNIGVAWRPNVQTGLLRKVLGDPELATVRAGYSVTYNREGMGVFTGQFGANPGSTLSVTRSEGNGLLVPAGSSQTWPVLFADRSRLALGEPCTAGVINAGCNPGSPSYPIPVRANRADSVNMFHPDLQVSHAKSYSIGLQRAISRDMAVDVRYIGTRGVNQWTEENWNEVNLIENGFYDEFLNAMANLQVNQAAGRGNTFAYFGPGTGTSPLPTYLAYFNARADAGNASAYTGSTWTNSTFVGRLARTNPNPASAASDLDGNDGRRANALLAGLPANHFVLNPHVDDVDVFVGAAFSSYDALQIEVRRRLSRGLQINGSYAFAFEEGSSFQGRHYGRISVPGATVRHAFKVQWDWTVPVGRGRRFGTDMSPWLDAVVGGWEFNGAGRVQARVLNFGNVRLVGMSVDELTDEYRFRVLPNPNDPTLTIVSMLPEDIILNTRRAFNTSATTATGYSALGAPEGRYLAPANSVDCIQLKAGDCAPPSLLVRAPWFTRFDLSVGKRFVTGRRINFELRFDLLNAFDNVNFNPVANPGTGETIFQTNSAYSDISNTFDPGGRLGQIVWRINW
jgi:hypothetical protein